MTDRGPQAAPRRFLIATAVAHSRRSREFDRPGLVQARQRVIDLFTGELGYTHVTELGLDPDRTTLLEFLERFASDPDRRPDDLVAFYLAGHGGLVDSSERRHVFFDVDADVGKPVLALATSQIAAALVDNAKIPNLLFMLDTCFSGQGGADAVAECLATLQRDLEGVPTGIVVVASAQPAQQARVAAFPELLAEAVSALNGSGLHPHGPTIGALIEHMNDSPERPPTQRFEWNAVKLNGQIPAFFATGGSPGRDKGGRVWHGGWQMPLMRVTRTTFPDGSRTEEIDIFDAALAYEALHPHVPSEPVEKGAGDE